MLNIKLLYHHQTFNANQNLEVSMVEECKSGRLTRDIWPQPTPGPSITTKLASAARGINILHCNGAKAIECEVELGRSRSMREFLVPKILQLIFLNPQKL